MNGVLTDEELQRRLAALRPPGPAAAEAVVTQGIDTGEGQVGGVSVSASAPSPIGPAPTIANGEGAEGSGRSGVESQTLSNTASPQHYRYLRPLTDAAAALIDVWQNTEGRFMFGLRPIDIMTRGVGRGQLAYITGRSHSGKTQLFLNAAARTSRPLVLFTLDETAEEVLAKLHCLSTGADLETTERFVAAGDAATIASVARVASQDFQHLLVFDDVLSLDAMASALDEARAYFQADPAAVCIDYLGLLTEGEEVGDIASKSKALKRWTKEQDLPVVCIHQGSRTNSKSGQHLSMEAMTHAGENEASFVIGVRRKRDDPNLDAYETQRHRDTVHVSVIKNKRPPSKRGEHEFILDPRSGVIRPLQEEDVVVRSPYQTRQQMAEVNGGLF